MPLGAVQIKHEKVLWKFHVFSVILEALATFDQALINIESHDQGLKMFCTAYQNR